MKQKTKGFTLVELMVVIAVVGILASVLLPNVQNLIRKGKVAAALSELHTFEIACLMYNDEQTGMPPGYRWASWDMTGLGASINRYLDKAVGQDPWKTNYYYNNCGFYSGWSYTIVVLSFGDNKSNDGSCRRCAWCCFGRGNAGGGAGGAGGVGKRICGDDLRALLKR